MMETELVSESWFLTQHWHGWLPERFL
jgi:hypothetical protein